MKRIDDLILLGEIAAIAVSIAFVIVFVWLVALTLGA